MNKLVSILILFGLFIIPYSYSLNVNIPNPIATNYTLVNTNQSNYWSNYLYSDYNMPLILSYAYNQTQATYNLWNDKWSATGNPFDQSLNTTDDVFFNRVYASNITTDLFIAGDTNPVNFQGWMEYNFIGSIFEYLTMQIIPDERFVLINNTLNVTSSIYSPNITADYFIGNGRYLTNLLTYNLTYHNKADYNFLGNNFNGSGNITTTGYFYGQPIQGAIGSGILSGTFDKRASLNVSIISGLNVSYPSFTARLITTDGTFANNCAVPSGTILVNDNANSVYYINRTCDINSDSFSNYETKDIGVGGVTSLFYVSSHSGNIENIIGTTQLGKVEIKLRQLTMRTDNMRVISGFEIQPATATLNFNITSGEYQYIRDIVPTTLRQVIAGKNDVEWVYHTGASTWGYQDGYVLNVTTCDTGTGIAGCSGSVGNFRRHFVFSVGYNSTYLDNTEIHQLLPLQSLSYSTLANCMDTSKNPLNYTIPNEYMGAVVMLYAVCLRRTDTNFDSTNIIDLRTVKISGANSGIDTTVFLRLDGTTPMTGNLNMSSKNITSVDCVYNQYGSRLCGNQTCALMYSPNGLSSLEICN